jgi:DUF438 domain-containing protein
MTPELSQEAKAAVMKDIILQLHQGLPVTEAKERFEREIGDVTSTEIAAMEQSLINEGLSVDEIKMFCNVHALLFQSALEKVPLEETSPAHPVSLFKAENVEITKLVASLREVAAAAGQSGADPAGFARAKEALKAGLVQLRGVEVHYERKEQILFPYLEKYGFMGPSKVMWGKDNEVRDMLKKALSDLEGVTGPEAVPSYVDAALTPLLDEIDGMVFKEENILLPTSLEKLQSADWVSILKQSPEIGYVFIQPPEEADILIRSLQAEFEEPVVEDGMVSLPSGKLSLNEVMGLLNTLPFDLTFVGADDTVKYFTEGTERIFARPRAVIGRKVQNCHPPQSLDVVEGILASFKAGEKDSYEFWINMQGKMVHIRYFAVRDKAKNYLGTLEVTQDITRIRKLEGEKRLVDERD